jgi:hypothetical protein
LSDKKVGSIVGDLEVIEALAAKLNREVCISTRQQYFAVISIRSFSYAPKLILLLVAG